MPSIVCNPEMEAKSAAKLDGFGTVATALLADAHSSVGALGEPLRNFGKRRYFIGEALTVRSGSLAQWKALDLARSGQVLVIATGGRRNESEFGAVFVKLALRKGIAAIVTDGLLRDRDEIQQLDIAVFACGSHPSSPDDPQQGRIGFPEALAGARVATGDIVMGDADGLAIIPRDALPAVLEKLEGQRKREHDYGEAGAGTSLPKGILEAVRAVPVVEHAEGH
jgi:4-hydroxy-4-methyl-2-oxoglutarate aldolase